MRRAQDDPTLRNALRTKDQHKQLDGSFRSTKTTAPRAAAARAATTAGGSFSGSSIFFPCSSPAPFACWFFLDSFLCFVRCSFGDGGKIFATGSPGNRMMSFKQQMASLCLRNVHAHDTVKTMLFRNRNRLDKNSVAAVAWLKALSPNI
jgi:hypothetical protein